MSELVDGGPATTGAVLEIAPAMESRVLPDWPGARWIGTVDMKNLPGHARLRLLNHAGYEHARLLVREGTSVRGFVEIETPESVLDSELLGGQ